MRRLIPILFCAVSTLQVIYDPYKGLDYKKINVYDIDHVYLEDCIHVTLGDGYTNSDEDVEEEEIEVEPEDKEEELLFLAPKQIKPWW
jgi:hypothetical protein